MYACIMKKRGKTILLTQFDDLKANPDSARTEQEERRKKTIIYR